MDTGESHIHCHALMTHQPGRGVLTIRALSGISGDMMLCGLMRMNGLDSSDLADTLSGIMPELAGCLSLERASVRHVGGWRLRVDLPCQHVHRTLADMESIIAESPLGERARALALDCFGRVARAEAAVHDMDWRDVRFHEVGALDSILDILLASELFARLDPGRLVASPLPLADGQISCAHGILPSPAPAVLEMLEGVPVRPFPGTGETVTPTGLALLLAFGASFGPWPAMCVRRQALVYGSRVFADAPNGAIFAYGECAEREARAE